LLPQPAALARVLSGVTRCLASWLLTLLVATYAIVPVAHMLTSHGAGDDHHGHAHAGALACHDHGDSEPEGPEQPAPDHDDCLLCVMASVLAALPDAPAAVIGTTLEGELPGSPAPEPETAALRSERARAPPAHLRA
jgi:hypothetical protein